LSDRFTQLHSVETSDKGHVKKQRKQLTKNVATMVQSSQKQKRQDNANIRRGLPAGQKTRPKIVATMNKKPKLAILARGKGKASRAKVKIAGRVKAEGKPRGGKSEPKKPEDLDMELDDYWHKAGKGPDPKQLQLDKQMDQYWASKPVEERLPIKAETE